MRADAARNIERILDAAVDELTLDPGASMAAVAKRAGVVRATLYVHFPTREALIDAVTERAMTEAAEAVRMAEPANGDPAEALARVLAAAWRTVGRYHALVAISTRLGRASDHAMHAPVLSQLAPILERGRRDGSFDPSLPTEWMLAVALEIVHAASRAVASGQLEPDEAERLLTTTVLGALAQRE
jgi:TetR/AcrR family transcriptional repressor of mexCD-oprJ operon